MPPGCFPIILNFCGWFLSFTIHCIVAQSAAYLNTKGKAAARFRVRPKGFLYSVFAAGAGLGGGAGRVKVSLDLAVAGAV